MSIIKKVLRSITINYISLLIVLCLLFSSIPTFAQKDSDTKLYTKPMKDSIVLRWQLFDSKLWEKQILTGYDIYRKGKDGSIKKINDSTIKALNPTQFAFHYLTLPAPIRIDTNKIDFRNQAEIVPDTKGFKYAPDTIAQKAMILLFAKEVGFDFVLPSKDEDMYFGDDPVTVRWLFHTLICYDSKEAAIVSGMYYVDKKVSSSETYTYYLTIAGKGMNGVLAQSTLSPSDPYKLIEPKGFTDITNKNRALLTWKKVDTLGFFIPLYDIFRSEQKNSGYVKKNQLPIYALYEGESILDSTIVSFNDSTLEKGKTYYYKARGKDVFGDYTPFSQPYQVNQRTYMVYTPIIDKITKSIKPLEVNLHWMIEKVDEENIAQLKLFKSTKPDTLFVPIADKLKLTDRSYTDKNLTKNNYYKLLMVGKAGDSLWSSPSYMLIPDSIAPMPPVIKSAICDSLGRVTITWSHNKEIDLYGFIIYKGNYKNEEFARIVNILKIDTIYVDTISLRVMDDAVYYELVAMDDSYNRSAASNIMRAKRYDTIIPTSAVFRTFKSNKEGILLEWGNSSSSDVVKTTLYRRLKGEISWHAYKVFAHDTAKYTRYTDTSLVKGKWYEYKLQTTDDDKLVSEFSNTLTIKAYDDGIRPVITDVVVKANTRKGIVKITWKYGYPGVKNFQVYRGENDKKPIILKSVKADVFEFYDQRLAPGATYKYIIKAEYIDGGESPFSKEVIVIMK